MLISRNFFVILFLVGLTTLFSTAVAAAQDGPPPADESGADKVTSYDFDDDVLTGDLVRPDGEMLQVRRAGDRNSLIRVREHFVPELMKSVEDL